MDNHHLIRQLMEQCVGLNASDLHISVGLPATYRIHGKISQAQSTPYNAEQVAGMAQSLMNDLHKEYFKAHMTLDMGFTSDNGFRFRVNLYRERGNTALAIRYLDGSLKTLPELGLPPQINYLTSLKSGLVLVCGATGSGKSSTLTAILNEINEKQEKHILTVEDPIEFVHSNIRSIVHQRELHSDVPDFASAVKAALREDPDIIMIGEMRDLDTMRTALTAAETGHLVFSTLHTNDAVGVVERLIGSFPGNEQAVARQRIAHALKAVIAQNLLPTLSGDGRAVVAEILMVTTAVANLIESAKSKQIYSVMESSTRQGMQTLDQALARLVAQRTISHELGKALSRDSTSFDSLVRGA
ncbi:type IV pilus twitching motility protein PilT [Neptunomonas japonica]|uniref:type IV pilus twitching motility protein PilT n=1 Tax=Neptunomonas japonica TaxID=417574 RepID=UPI000423A5CA|nr:PilT/PilU family type 4a pilus ATPase [Neptunomonas japonica]